MSGKYAQQTNVSVAKSRAELESLLAKYGGEAFAYAQDSGRVLIGFRIESASGRKVAVKMELPLPLPSEERFKRKPWRNYTKPRTPEEVIAAHEQECRSLWRALVLVVRAKLEACTVGISTIEREFMADILMPDGRTLTQHLGLQIDRMLEAGSQAPLLLTAS